MMTDRYEVISAFLDDEPFDPQELAEALSEASARALLIDLVALRHLVQPDERASSATAPGARTWRVSLRLLAAAAAVFLALVTGYLAGERRGGPPSEPPAPTRIVQGPASWQQMPKGGL